MFIITNPQVEKISLPTGKLVNDLTIDMIGKNSFFWLEDTIPSECKAYICNSGLIDTLDIDALAFYRPLIKVKSDVDLSSLKIGDQAWFYYLYTYAGDSCFLRNTGVESCSYNIYKLPCVYKNSTIKKIIDRWSKSQFEKGGFVVDAPLQDLFYYHTNPEYIKKVLNHLIELYGKDGIKLYNMVSGLEIIFE